MLRRLSFLVACITLACISGCGGSDGQPVDDNVVLSTGEKHEFTTSNVLFTITRISNSTGSIQAQNLNSTEVNILVRTLNQNSQVTGIALDEKGVEPQDIIHNPLITLTPGTTFQVTVEVLKDGILDKARCLVDPGFCVQARGTTDITIGLVPTS